MHLERFCNAVLATPSHRKGLGSPCLTNMEFSSLPKEHPARLLLSQARSCPSIRLSSHRRAPPLIVDSSLPKQPPLLYSLPRKNVPPASKNVPLQVPPLQPPLDAGHLPRPPRGADRLPRRQGRRICHPCTCSSPGQKKKEERHANHTAVPRRPGYPSPPRPAWYGQNLDRREWLPIWSAVTGQTDD